MAKAYGVIDRFSEDIDILLDWRLLGYKQNEPLEPTSNNKRNDMKKDMNRRTVSYLENEMLPVIQSDIMQVLGPNYKVFIADNDCMSIQFEYPKEFSHNPSILSAVKLEIGPMSQWSQLFPKPISSMIDVAHPEANIFSPLEVLSVSPERTFWDKISILQNISHWHDKDASKPLKSRYSRHYYDVFCILNSAHKNSCIDQANLFFEAMDFSARFYPVTTFDYKAVNFSNLQLEIPQSLMNSLREDYERMKDMIYGPAPSFDVIYAKILAFQEEIRIHHQKAFLQKPKIDEQIAYFQNCRENQEKRNSTIPKEKRR